MVHLERFEDRVHLLGDDRQDVHLDSVELIEAAPASGLNESGEHPPDRLGVEAFGAIEDEHEFGEGLPQVLNGLGLACSCRALRLASLPQDDGGR